MRKRRDHDRAKVVRSPPESGPLHAEGGAAWELTEPTVRKHDVIGNLKRVIEGARERGIAVLFAPMAYTEADYRKHRLHERSGINRVQFERKMFLAGSWGADFHPELRPRDGEIVLLPHKGIDVFMTDLPTHLERLGITKLVIAGMTANLCIESTGRHAMEKGYDVTYLPMPSELTVIRRGWLRFI